MATHHVGQAGIHGNATDITGIVSKAAAAAASAVASAAAIGGSAKPGGAVTSKGVFDIPGEAGGSSGGGGGDGGVSGDSVFHGHEDFLPGAYDHYDDPQSMIPPSPAHLLIICTVLYVAIFVMGLIGNIAVILVVLQCRSMRTSINLLFLNLCLADLFALVITGPTVVADMLAKENWYLGAFMCKLITFLENVVGNASAVTILAISVERHRVAYRSSHSTVTSVRGTVCKSFMLIWLASLLGALPMIFIANYEKDEYVDGTPVGRCMTPIELTWQKMYLVVSALIFFILPLIVILLLYSKVYMKLMTLFRREQERCLTYPREILRLKRQMTQIIITVVLVFFICHTPYRIIGLWSVFSIRDNPQGVDNESYFAMFYFTRFLLYSNHAINPFVYNFVSRKFRRALLWLCCERRRRNVRLDEWKDLVHNGQPIRMDSLRQHHHRQSTAGRLYDIDNNVASNKEEMEALERRSHFQRNDFLVLYEHLLLE